MHKIVRACILVCIVDAAMWAAARNGAALPREQPADLPDCGGTPSTEGVTGAARSRGSTLARFACTPPYDDPEYTPPPDDGVALSSLLEAAGHAVRPFRPTDATIAAGHFCGEPQTRQLFLVLNRVTAAGRPPHVTSSTASFSLLQGPTPHFVMDLNGLPAYFGVRQALWRAATAANLTGGPYDQIVLFRSVSERQVPDLTLLSITSPVHSPDLPLCGNSSVVAAATIGDPVTRWAGAAVGKFDRTGRKRIALLDRARLKLALVELNQTTLTKVFEQDLPDEPLRASNWKTLVAGDLDGDGVDELIAARSVSDGRSPTIVAFKWTDTGFTRLAASSFGNTGNSSWVAAAAGDFNADGRYAVVLAKNKHSNFAVVDLPQGATELQVRTTSDLDSVDGQPWTGLAATDWLGGDRGAAELIAFRKVTRPYRTNVFVYGDRFHRIPRDTGLEGTKAQWVQHVLPRTVYFTPPIRDLKAWIRGTHTNVFNWVLQVTQDPPLGPRVHDYADLVRFLSETQNFGVDGKQLRVWVTLIRPVAVDASCALPENTPAFTSWNAIDYFQKDFAHDYANLTDDDKIAACRDFGAWAAVLGRLAQQFPHLVAVGVDDFSDSLDGDPSPDCRVEFEQRTQFSEDCIAGFESTLREQAPWLNFVPTVYYDYFRTRISGDHWADLPLTLDSMQFFFRNNKHRMLIDRTRTCLLTVENAPDEIRDMHQLLPAGRKLQLGIYFVGCGTCSEGDETADRFTPPPIRYDYDLVRIGRNMPIVGGVTAYGLQTPPWQQAADQAWEPCTGSGCHPDCNEFNFLTDTDPPGIADNSVNNGYFPMWGTDRYCALRKAYGDPPQIVTHVDLTPTASTAVSDPSAYYTSVDATRHVIYRSGDGHLYEIWSSSSSFGRGELIPSGPFAAGNPASYFVPPESTQHVIYHSSADNHLRELWWSGTESARGGDLIPAGPAARGNPSAYFLPTEGSQHVIYRDAHDHVRELWWFGPASPGDNDLSGSGSLAAGSPWSFLASSDGTQHVVYRGHDNHLHEVIWGGADPLTGHDVTPNGPAAAGDPSGYFTASDSMRHVFYRSAETPAHLYELWLGGAVPSGRGDITAEEVASPPASNPAAYFVDVKGTHHVVYRSQDNHVHELSWTVGAVTHNDLTALTDAPGALGNPAAYYFADEGVQHVFYRGVDGHIHEFRWTQ